MAVEVQRRVERVRTQAGVYYVTGQLDDHGNTLHGLEAVHGIPVVTYEHLLSQATRLSELLKGEALEHGGTCESPSAADITPPSPPVPDPDGLPSWWVRRAVPIR